jgi:hypothetical protein
MAMRSVSSAYRPGAASRNELSHIQRNGKTLNERSPNGGSPNWTARPVVTREVLGRVPEGENSWKPHPKSMPLGNLPTIVANTPAWLHMVVNPDELDTNPSAGLRFRPPGWKHPE